MARASGDGSLGHPWARRASARTAWAALTAAAVAAALTGSAPAARLPEVPRHLDVVTRPVVRQASLALEELLALADAALADGAATARTASDAAPPELLATLARAEARLVTYTVPGGRGPLSPPPGQQVRLSEIESAVGAVFRAAADVRATGQPAASTVAVGWAAPETLGDLEAAVADARAAAAALAPLELQPYGWVHRDHPAVDEADLCPIPFQPTQRLRCDAAAALGELNAAYRADHGADLVVSSSFRTYAEQVALRNSLGSLAAAPGTSNHEKGVAVDLAGVGPLGDFSSAAFAWLNAHAPRHGWAHPPALGPGGSGPEEPWHWEYIG